MQSDNEHASGKQLFADLTVDRGVLTARLVGPTLGQREGPVVADMIGNSLESSDGPIGFVVLDCSDIGYINSAGLGACVTIHTQAKTHKAVVVLHALKPELRDIFKLTKLDKIFKITEDSKRLEKILGRH